MQGGSFSSAVSDSFDPVRTTLTMTTYLGGIFARARGLDNAKPRSGGDLTVTTPLRSPPINGEKSGYRNTQRLPANAEAQKRK